MSFDTVVKPTITGKDGKVRIDLPPDYYIEMTADVADEFARQILVQTAKARGQTGHVFIVPAVETKPLGADA